ncbi:energy transducer TonB [Hymenobacter sp. B81]|uniref:energy transducer TonB n=1 Tax=Hymenobacter sp. B81 TaxID=3344878 RepID=UPI0037DDA0FD
MPTTNLHSAPASLDDIVFEGRNKAYGAYQLRQAYHRHLQRAVLGALGLLTLLLLAVFARQYFVADTVVAPAFEPEGTLVKLIDVPLPKPAQPVATVAPAPAAAPEVPTRVVEDAKARIRPATPAVEPMTAPIDGLPTGTGTAPSVVIGSGTGDSGTVGTGVTVPAVIPAPTKTGPFLSVEVMPEFTGGQQALMQYLRKNLRYPPRALAEQVEGKVFVSFTVSAAGSITDVEILKGLGYGTDEEAQRVISNMPRWEPGRQNGNPVAVRYTLPITFHFSR